MLNKQLLSRAIFLAIGLFVATSALNSMTPVLHAQKTKKRTSLYQQELTCILNIIQEQLASDRDYESGKIVKAYNKWKNLPINNHVKFAWFEDLVKKIFNYKSDGIETILNNTDIEKIETNMPIDELIDFVFILNLCKKRNNPSRFVTFCVYTLTYCCQEKIECIWAIDSLLTKHIQNLEALITKKEQTKKKE